MKEFSCLIDGSNPAIYSKEWFIANGLGGFACGTIGGALRRKYHGILVSALKAPLGRTVMLNHVEESIFSQNQNEIHLSILQTEENEKKTHPYLVNFRLENLLPIWDYQIGDIHLEKSLWMAHGQNTVYIRYQVHSSKEPVQMKWRPFLHFRSTEQSVDANADKEYQIQAQNGTFEISTSDFPGLKISNSQQATFVVDFQQIGPVFYEIEKKRGYEFTGNLKSPGFFSVTLKENEKTAFIASTETWNVMHSMTAAESLIAERVRKKSLIRVSKPLSSSPISAKLVLAADQFIMTPISREMDMFRLKAMGEQACSIVAGYPWFTDWGRDTMISLEGLTLVTGRAEIARSILSTFAYYIKDGLIPNMFPDGESHGLYHTADATLWFFHAIDRYLSYTGDVDFLEYILSKLHAIIEYHIQGTHFGIKMDQDGLLIQGEEGYQLTWMDAKVGDWVVTPRRGKAVEINALWYNALKLIEKWTGKHGDLAKRCYDSFNEKFWHEEGKYLYDVIGTDGEKDAAVRPNQVFAISLEHPILEKARWPLVLNVIKEELLTPYGLRTLSPLHLDYKAYYFGDIFARDAAYHQGTIWPWLVGPFIDAWLKTYPDKKMEALDFLKSLEVHINEHCIGTIAEIFDAADPYHARGCFAQAWSVAEFLRAYALLHP